MYLAKGLTLDIPPDTPLAYEPLGNHRGPDGEAGMNIPLADGHACWFPADKAAEVLKRASSATQPATAPATMP